MAKLTLQWRGRQTTMKGTPRGSTMCAHSVEGETQRAVTRSKQRLPLGLQSRHTIGIEEGEQESQSPPAILECTSSEVTKCTRHRCELTIEAFCTGMSSVIRVSWHAKRRDSSPKG